MPLPPGQRAICGLRIPEFTWLDLESRVVAFRSDDLSPGKPTHSAKHLGDAGVHPQVPAGRSLPRRRVLMMPLALAPAWRTAFALDRPAGPVVLTVSGRVRRPNVGDLAQFDMAMLEQLPQHSFVTRTPWYPEARKFTGPLLRDVLSACGAQGSTLRAIALNDYRVDLPFDDAQRFDVVVARLLDEKPMAVRDKGPLFVIYPFDSNPQLRNTVYFSRSAWQLRALEVL